MVNKRIETICSYINNDYSVCDVGCDHGYLALILKENGHKGQIICSDNKPGPLSQAKKNLANYDDVSFVLADGASGLNEDVDCIIMAGMGNETIEHIMTLSEERFRNCKQIILQTNKNANNLRKWLNENNYMILDEDIVFDYKFYEIVICKNGTETLSEKEIFFGPKMLEKKSATFKDFLLKQISINQQIIKKIKATGNDYSQYSNLIEKYKEVIDEF